MNKGILIVVVVLVIAALAGLGWIVSHRSQPAPVASPQQTSYSSNLDDYVSPHKLYAYDLKSAKKELVGKTVWVKPDNSLSAYRYGGGGSQGKMNLAPLEKLEIQDVVLRKTSATPQIGQFVVEQEQVMAVFHKAGQTETYAVPIGASVGGNYHLQTNEKFYIDDPHELYKHWPPEVWNAIDHHEVRPGMNELQASFALGPSASSEGGPYGNRTMKYANGGNAVSIKFANNQAVEIVPAASK